MAKSKVGLIGIIIGVLVLGFGIFLLVRANRKDCNDVLCDPDNLGFDMEGKANECCQKDSGGNGEGGGNGGNNGGGGKPTPPLNTVIGKRVYAKSEEVNVRSSPNVNNGWINNILCELEPLHEPAPVVIDLNRTGSDKYTWYKIKFDSAKETNTDGCYHLNNGWVREDVVTLK